METPDPPNDTPGALKQVVLTPHDIPWSLREECISFLTKNFIQAKSCDGQEVEGHGTQSENGPGAQTRLNVGFFSPKNGQGWRCSNMWCVSEKAQEKYVTFLFLQVQLVLFFFVRVDVS